MKAKTVPIREDRPDRDHHNATQLLNAAMTYARLILKRYGQISPFAFSVNGEGEVSRETLNVPRLPRDPQTLYKLLAEHVAGRIRRGAIQGVAVCANVALASPSAEGFLDAVILNIEQASGHALEVTVPYRIYGGQMRNLLPRRIALGKHLTEETQPRFFAAPD